jgi:hypothetical protein
MLDGYLEIETNDDVLSALQEHFFRVSQKQLNRYRYERALPRPQRHGKGRGIRVENSAGTGDQAYELVRILCSDRSFRDARWLLWLWGFRIDQEEIHSFLKEKVKAVMTIREAFLNAGDGEPDDAQDVLDDLGKWARKRLGNKTFGRIRRALGKERFPWFVHLFLWGCVGLFDGWVDPEEDQDVLALALQPKGALDESQLVELSQLADPIQLSGVLDSTAPPDFEDARQWLIFVLQSLEYWLTPERIWNVEKVVGKRTAELLRLSINEPDFYTRVTPYLLLMSLSVLKSGGTEAFERLLGDLPQGGWPIGLT